MNAIKTFTANNKVLNIFVDNNPESPRTSMDNLGTMLCSHKRYSLGDEKEKFDFDSCSSWSEVKTALMKEKNIAVILPLYLYDHSGITMKTTSFNDQWDSGQVGFIYVTKEKLKEEYSKKRISKELIAKVTQYLIGEVETYDTYLTGDIYGFQLKDSEGNDIDSCWGFYGSDLKTNGIIDHIEDDELIELLEKD